MLDYDTVCGSVEPSFDLLARFDWSTLHYTDPQISNIVSTHSLISDIKFRIIKRSRAIDRLTTLTTVGRRRSFDDRESMTLDLAARLVQYRSSGVCVALGTHVTR